MWIRLGGGGVGDVDNNKFHNIIIKPDNVDKGGGWNAYPQDLAWDMAVIVNYTVLGGYGTETTHNIRTSQLSDWIALGAHSLWNNKQKTISKQEKKKKNVCTCTINLY